MQMAKGCMEEIYLDGQYAARISCLPALVPAPGQYLLASCSSDPSATLSHPLIQAGTCPGGFYAARPLPANWLPGASLQLRGPLGNGFHLPPAARRMALLAWSGPSDRLLALLQPALAQKAAVVLLTDYPPQNLPTALEIQPLSSLVETCTWADYLAIDANRLQLPDLLPILLPDPRAGAIRGSQPIPRAVTAQILVRTPLLCAGVGACGVCAVRLTGNSRDYKLACKDGPVFKLY